MQAEPLQLPAHPQQSFAPQLSAQPQLAAATLQPQDGCALQPQDGCALQAPQDLA